MYPGTISVRLLLVSCFILLKDRGDSEVFSEKSTVPDRWAGLLPGYRLVHIKPVSPKIYKK